jgi:phage baseplate assembly protein gpV
MDGTSKYLGLTIGIVKNNADPGQHGRLQIYIPSIDSDSFRTEDLPWATYVSPYGGTTANAVVGRDGSTVSGVSSYGIWAVPQNGAQVLCGFINGDSKMRFWLGCVYMPELNRTMPQGVDGYKTEIDKSGLYPQKEMSHVVDNLTKAGLDPKSANFKTRGWERSISYPSNGNDEKKADNGYGTKPLDKTKSESQIISVTSPGRHYFLMSDVVDNCKVRVRTSAGSQMIFDDTNERIYISTAKGMNYIEMDESNGKIYVYSDSKINVRAKNDINFYSDNNINIVAKKRVNIQSETRGVAIQSNNSIQLTSGGGDINLNASRGILLKTSGGSTAGAVGGSTTSSPGGVGLVRDFPESAGSGAASVKIDAKDAVEILTANKIVANAGGSIQFNSGGSLAFISSSGSSLVLGGSATMSSSSGMGIKAPSFNVDAGSFGFKAIDPVSGLLTIKSTAGVSVNNPSAPSISSGAAASVSSVSASMIRPDHESWKRDEDEAQCKTPRNANWKP